MLEQIALNIMGTEWIIVVFAALVLLLGTGKLPAAAEKVGRAAAKIEKAKNDIMRQTASVSSIKMDGPVETERQKLETMAESLGIDHTDVPTEELRKTIWDKMGGSAKSD